MNTNTIHEYEYEHNFLRIFKIRIHPVSIIYEYYSVLILNSTTAIVPITALQIASKLKTAIKIGRDADAEMDVVMREVEAQKDCLHPQSKPTPTLKPT